MVRHLIAHVVVANLPFTLAAFIGRALRPEQLQVSDFSQVNNDVAESEVLPMPKMNSTEISCYIKMALVEATENITLFGSNDTLGSLQAQGKLPTLWRTCSVVSSSGVVMLKNQSQAIDKSDAVIHFNTAPLKGYEGWVGSRDDVRFVNNQFAKLVLDHSTPLETNNHTMYINVLPAYDKDAHIEQTGQYEELLKQRPGLRIFEAAPTIEHRASLLLRHIYSAEWFHEQGSSYLPTTGGVGMILALSMCDTVFAYGMAESENSKSAPYHYYDGEGTVASEQDYHRSFSAEKDLWRRLSVSQVADIDANDVAEIPGLSHYECSNFARSLDGMQFGEALEEADSKTAPALSMVLPAMAVLSSLYII
mmetsp:Transcript_18695/g.43713  ORF Transcript_18695/g.43713 Transcript_18695/m.43713 type:complete len:364 (-) Transcript_18695:72-1163(-)